jgi:ABC-type Na+ efflux pump permease subunit
MLKYFVKRYTVRRGALMFGKMLPIGIGAAVGGAGNRMVGKKIVRNARQAFGVPPGHWPTTLRLLPPIHETG